MLGQRVLDKERTEQIVLSKDEVIIGVKIGMRDPGGSNGKKEEGLVTSLQFMIAQI